MAARVDRRIGIDVTAALTQGGGIGRYTRELIHALADVDRESRYHLFSARRPAVQPVSPALPQAENFRHDEAPLPEKWLYRLWYRLRLPLPVQWVTGRLDLFHSPDFVLPPVGRRIPTLLTVHDLSFVHYPETFPAVLVDYLNRVVPWSVKRATHVLADSQATRDDLMSLWRVPAEKITVLYSGVNATFRPVQDGERAQSLRRKYGLGRAPYLLAVGTVQPRKNYEMLIRAFRPIAARFPHNLVIAGGSGWLHQSLTRSVAELGLAERVLFPGFVADADLPALYSHADLFLFPSLYEGFGLPLLEAMACGLPVITSNSSSLPEVAGEAAIQIPPTAEAQWTEAVRHLLTHADQRQDLVARGFRQAGRFSWRAAAEQLLGIYGRLLAA